MARNLGLELTVMDMYAFNCAVEDVRMRDIAGLILRSTHDASCDIDSVINGLSEVLEDLDTSPDIIHDALEYCVTQASKEDSL